jgi:DNA-binding PadR family transcriptional regulator
MLDKQLLKGIIPLLALSLLSDEDRYGYQLIKAMDELTAGAFRFAEGTLYPVLHSLERAGALRSEWEKASGRKRKYYHITSRGRLELEDRQAQWQQFNHAVTAVLSKGGNNG